MARRLAIDEALRSLPKDDAWNFERLVYGPGTPNFTELAEWLAAKGVKVKRESVAIWYRRNRDRYQTCPPELALWRTLTGAVERRDRLQTLVESNWDALERGFADNLGTPAIALKLLDAIATLDLGVRVASEQLHNLEVKLDQEKLVMATVNQVFAYLALEMERSGLDALRMEALEPMANAIADRISLENKFTGQPAAR